MLWNCVVIFLISLFDVLELAQECVLNEMLYAEELVLLSETINGVMNRFCI